MARDDGKFPDTWRTNQSNPEEGESNYEDWVTGELTWNREINFPGLITLEPQLNEFLPGKPCFADFEDIDYNCNNSQSSRSGCKFLFYFHIASVLLWIDLGHVFIPLNGSKNIWKKININKIYSTVFSEGKYTYNSRQFRMIFVPCCGSTQLNKTIVGALLNSFELGKNEVKVLFIKAKYYFFKQSIIF